MTDDGTEDIVILGPTRFLSLPLAEVFVVLSVNLGVLLGVIFGFGLFLSLISGSEAIVQGLHIVIQVLALLTFIPPFVTLLWLGTGLGALFQWMQLRRQWGDQPK